MMINAQLTAIPIETLEEHSEEIANYIQENISGRKARPELIDWVNSNIQKISHLGWNNYNGFSIDRKKEDEFDELLDEVESLKLR